MYSNRQALDDDTSEAPIGQAVSAPGRISPFAVDAFPPPPTSTPIAVSLPTHSRNLLDLSRVARPTRYEPDISSVFEYAHFAGSRHESLATTKNCEDTLDLTRQTRDWYEKPLWDRQDTVRESTYGGVERGRETERETEEIKAARSKTTKGVRWGDEALSLDPSFSGMATAV